MADYLVDLDARTCLPIRERVTRTCRCGSVYRPGRATVELLRDTPELSQSSRSAAACQRTGSQNTLIYSAFTIATDRYLTDHTTG